MHPAITLSIICLSYIWLHLRIATSWQYIICCVHDQLVFCANTMFECKTLKCVSNTHKLPSLMICQQNILPKRTQLEILEAALENKNKSNARILINGPITYLNFMFADFKRNWTLPSIVGYLANNTRWVCNEFDKIPNSFIPLCHYLTEIQLIVSVILIVYEGDDITW